MGKEGVHQNAMTILGRHRWNLVLYSLMCMLMKLGDRFDGAELAHVRWFWAAAVSELTTFFEGVHKVVVRNHIDRTKKNEGLGSGSSPMCWEILPHQLFQLTFCSLLDDSWDWDAYIFLCSVPASLNWRRVVEGHRRSAAVRHDNKGELSCGLTFHCSATFLELLVSSFCLV